MKNCLVTKMSGEELANVLSEVDISETVDIGCAFINVGKHPLLGDVICISGISDVSAFIQLSQ